jgi:hypothetical protein
MLLDLTTPAHERLVAELLAWDRPRPAADLELAGELRAALEAGVEDAARRIPDGRDVFVGKWSLDALVCDGWYRDRQDADFAWSVPAARGKLAHRAVELDWKLRRALPPDGVVARVWDELASDPRDNLAGYLNTVEPVDAAELRHDAEQLLSEFRDTWPAIPPIAAPRLEQRVRVRLAGGKVVLSGTPDLVLGRVRRDECRMLLVDFKTGQRKPQAERDELRFYALLLTLKYGVAPWRWAAYYVAECAWDAEDLDPDALFAAVRRVTDGVEQAVRLEVERVAEPGWTLRGGPHCAWCSRASTCPAYVPPRDPFDV